MCTFLEAGSGGPRAYTGRAMRDAHRGMNINEAEFVATLDDILLVLRKHGIDIVQRSKRIVSGDRPLGRLNTRSRTGVAANRRALDRQRNHEIRDLLWVLGAQPIVCGTTHARREVAITVAGCCVRPRHLEQPRRVHAA